MIPDSQIPRFRIPDKKHCQAYEILFVSCIPDSRFEIPDSKFLIPDS